ncbi:MAG: SBBP repeat-containing protein [Bacteroidota bacterium]
MKMFRMILVGYATIFWVGLSIAQDSWHSMVATNSPATKQKEKNSPSERIVIADRLPVAMQRQDVVADKLRIDFEENQGQVHDQYFQPRPDILFSGTNGRMFFHLKANGVSYQLNRIDSWKDAAAQAGVTKTGERNSLLDSPIPEQATIYRLDLNWLGAKTDVEISKSGELAGHNNYYLANCPDGIVNVKSYSRISYHEIYSGIDLHWYEKNGQLEYDYVVDPGADYKNIRMEIKGAESIRIDEKGNLYFTTPLGEIMEQAPVVLQEGRTLLSKWVLDGNVVSFAIENIRPDKSFIIDPVVRVWSTYYASGAGVECEIATDKFGNLFMVGDCLSSSGTAIATVGSHQTTFGGGAPVDAYVVKFSAAGARLWGTYYGGTENDFAMTCTADGTGAVYLSGYTYSTNAIATAGSHQPVFGGGALGDAYLVKFNGEGVREWATYYGGAESEAGRSCRTDINGNVYLAGHTTSSTGISTIGSHQEILGGVSGQAADAFLVKFNSSGTRQWATYYGGIGQDMGFSCATDVFGNVFLAGETATFPGTVIATSGSHQPLFSGGVYHGDAFLVKFNAAGVRQWGTYYGGVDDEVTGNPSSSIATDASGNVFMTGHTYSPTHIATATGHQPFLSSAWPNMSSGSDAYLVKFDAAGVRQWGTYYGDVEDDYGNACATDANGNVYMAGAGKESTAGSSIFVTPGAFQTVFGGFWDGFLVKFNSSGVRQWGTYFGGSGDEDGRSCAVDINGDIFVACNTSSDSGITTPGCYQPVFVPNSILYNPYLVKLTENVSTSTAELTNSELIYFHPNPTRDLIHLIADSRIVGSEYCIFDMQGRMVYSGVIGTENTAIDASYLSSGVYLFRVMGKWNQSFKLVKE